MHEVPGAQHQVDRFLRWAAAAPPSGATDELIDPDFSLDVVGRTPLSGHYASLAAFVSVLRPLAMNRIASIDWTIVTTLRTPGIIATQLLIKAVTRSGATYNPRGALSTLLLEFRLGRVVRARFWPDTEQVERALFGSDFV